jgi:2-polyprenyl-6-methoxyphenol hydroxylase-like FAD-dependent oxidoreductase
LIVGAYGRGEAIDKQLQRQFSREKYPYLGFKTHANPTEDNKGNKLRNELEGFVEIYAFEGGYCGLNFVETGKVNICCLLESRFMRSLPSTQWPSVLDGMGQASPPFRRRLEALEMGTNRVHSVANVPFCLKERSLAPLLFLGDAAGMITPMCGNGQSMALKSAVLLSRLISESSIPQSREDFHALAAQWNLLWKKEFGRRMAWGRRLQRIVFRRFMAEIAIRFVRYMPALSGFLARATRGAASSP